MLSRTLRSKSLTNSILTSRFLANIPRRAAKGYDSSGQISYVQGEPAMPLFFETTGDRFRRSVEAKPDKEFVIFRDQNIRKTFSQVYRESRRLAAGMLSLGLQKGDRVGVWGQNYYEWILCFNACAMAGLIQVNINPAYQAEELRYALQKVGVKALFTPKEFKHSKFIETLTQLAPSIASGKPGCGLVESKELPDLKHLIVFDEEKPINGAWFFPDIAKGAGSKDSKLLEEIENTILPDDPVNIQYTSGTTGFPKAATLTHHNILNNGYQIGYRSKWHEKDQIACIPNPLYHCFGCVIGVLNALCHTQTCVFPAVNYDVSKILKAIQEEKCTFVYGTPTMYIDILSNPQLNDYDMRSIRGGYLAGAPCPPALCQSLQRHLHMDDLLIVYGSTELSPAVTMSDLRESPLERIRSVGSVMPSTEVAIVDPTGKCLKRGERGELLARGYMTMRGYWGDEEKTKKDLTPDNWYHTGDTAYMLENGNVCIVGRTKDMIIRGGENVYPTEVEQFIGKQPYVADVQVIGVPDERYGEAVCAWVRLKASFEGKITEDDVIKACKGQIAHYKVPKYVLIKEQKDFPLTATGKVKKFELREISKKILKLENVKSHFSE